MGTRPLEFSSLFSEVALAVNEEADVLDVRTGVVMPHSIRILSGSTFKVSMPVNVFRGEVEPAAD